MKKKPGPSKGSGDFSEKVYGGRIDKDLEPVLMKLVKGAGISTSTFVRFLIKWLLSDRGLIASFLKFLQKSISAKE